MGWIHIDDKDDNKSGYRSNMRENMRENMRRMYSYREGMRENYHNSTDEQWCDGYEQGWKDCMKEIEEKRNK